MGPLELCQPLYARDRQPDKGAGAGITSQAVGRCAIVGWDVSQLRGLILTPVEPELLAIGRIAHRTLAPWDEATLSNLGIPEAPRTGRSGGTLPSKSDCPSRADSAIT
jgi:hypothetical protein